MRIDIGCVAVFLLGLMGCMADAAALGGGDTSLAGKRGLSPIISPIIMSPIITRGGVSSHITAPPGVPNPPQPSLIREGEGRAGSSSPDKGRQGGVGERRK